MKKLVIGMAVIIGLALMLSGCGGTNETGGNKDDGAVTPQTDTTTETASAISLESFVKAFEDAGYEVTDKDIPAFQMIQAVDGVIFYIDGSPVKIYQYADEDAYKKAVEGFPMLEDMTKNGLFVAESSSQELLEFFSTIK